MRDDRSERSCWRLESKDDAAWFRGKLASVQKDAGGSSGTPQTLVLVPNGVSRGNNFTPTTHRATDMDIILSQTRIICSYLTAIMSAQAMADYK